MRLLLLALVLCTAAGTLVAQNADNEHSGMAILHLGRLNRDCFPDTLWGDRDAAGNYLPRVIAWGQPPDTAGKGRHFADSVEDCHDRIAKHLKVKSTTIEYPGWAGLMGSVAYQNMNPDTVPDMFFTLWGRVETKRGAVDTARMFVVFAQTGLDTLKKLDLSDVRGLRRDKFTALELTAGVEVRDPRQRDLSGRTSWEVFAVDVVVDGEEEGRPERDDPDATGPLLNEKFKIQK